MIILHKSDYDANTTHLGYGEISDAISCEITEELNGEYTLEMVYPVQGRRFPYIQVRNVILASVRPDDNKTQPFRIMSVSKPLDGKVTVRANHISYDLSGYIIAPLTMNDSVGNVLTTIFSMPTPTNPFTPYTNKTTTGTFVNRYHSSIRSNLAGRRGSVLDKYGGEFEWDNFTVKLLTRRGANNGVRIEYGKNLTGLDVDTDASNVYSHVQAYWYDADTNTESYGARQETGATGLERTLILDASEDYDTAPVASTLNTYAQNYMSTHDLTAPTISVSANFVDLSQTEEYKNYRGLERVDLGDTVTVYHAGLEVNITTRVKKTVFDVLRDRYTSLKLGNVRAGIVDQIVSNSIVSKDAMTAVQTMTYINNETAKCLKLSGGTMVGQIDRDGNGGAYYKGRDNAPLKTTAASNSAYFYPIVSNKSNSGTWDVGTIGNNLAIHYQSDSDYTNNQNTGTAFSFDSSGNYSGTATNVSGVVGYDHGGTAATSLADAQSNLKILKTTGGTMTGQIETVGSGGAYWRGRENALAKTTAATSASLYYPINSIKTQSGTWDIGIIGEKLAFHYQKDTDYTASTNTNATYTIDTDGSYSGGSSITIPVPISDGGTAATTAKSAASNLFSFTPTFTTPSVGTYADSVSGGYIELGNLTLVNMTITTRSTATTGGTARTMVTGLPTPANAVALAVAGVNAGQTHVDAVIATNGRINFYWDSTSISSLSYRVAGVYLNNNPAP